MAATAKNEKINKSPWDHFSLEKTLTKVYLLAIPFMLLGTLGQAQDQNYTQYQNAPLYYNPALTGSEAGLHTWSLGRIQWTNLPVDYQSFNFSGDFGQRKLPGVGGIGLLVNGGLEGGLINSLRVGLSFTSRIQLSSVFAVQIGILGSVMQRNIDWDNLVFANQMDPIYGTIYPSSFVPPDGDTKTVGDVGAGFLLQYESKSKSFANNTGVAVDHIFEPNVSFLTDISSPYPRKWVVHSDFRISTGECSTCGMKGPGFADPLQITPGIMYQYQSGYNTVIGGTDLMKFNFIFGVWGRYNITHPYPAEVFSFKAGYRIAFSKDNWMRFLYSIDLATEEFAGSIVQAHELSLTLFFGSFHKQEKETVKPAPVPPSSAL